jgi:glycosyltransferase involved in cell wall biosynthesis
VRIQRVTRRLPPCPGGQEIHIYELTRRQLERGHEIDIWFTEGEEVPPGAKAHRVASTAFGHKPHSVVVTSALYAWRAERRMKRASRPDLVHVHGDYAEAFFATSAARAHRVPTVMTVHGGLNVRHRAISRHVLHRVDQFIALGTRVREDLVHRAVPADRITVMSSGLNRDLLTPHVGARRADHPLVVSVGSLDPVKNHDTVIAAARILAESYPDLEVVIVGDGRERPRLEALADGMKLSFAGHLSRPEVYALVSQAWVFTLASQRLASKAEGVPTALLEAMALARPCVVSTACTLDGIAPAESGAFIAADPQRPDDFAYAIARLLEDPSYAREVGKRAETTVAKLGWDDITERVESVYAKALAAS